MTGALQSCHVSFSWRGGRTLKTGLPDVGFFCWRRNDKWTSRLVARLPNVGRRMTTTVLRSTTTGRRSPSKWGDVDPATAAEMTAADDAGIKAADRSSLTGDRKNVNPNGPPDNGGDTGRSPGGRGATGENPPGLGRTTEGTKEHGPATLDRPKQGRPEPERPKPPEQQERDLRWAEASLLFLKKGTRKTVPNGFKSWLKDPDYRYTCVSSSKTFNQRRWAELLKSDY